MASTDDVVLQPKVFPDSYYEDPTVFQFFERIGIAVNEFSYNFTKYPVDYDFMFSMLTSVRLDDVLAVLVLAAVLTVLRFLATNYISLPAVNALRIKPANSAKWAESVWKFLSYSCLWSYSLYVVILSGRYDFFYKPVDVMRSVHFDEHYLSRRLPTDVYWMYAVQLGYYVHSIFGTLCMDVWRKDSVIMLFHHCITIFLLEFSFLMKYYQVGAIVLFLHDLSDILLEFTKLNVYLKDRGGKKHRVHEWLANVGFGVFTLSWAWFRLYWFPLKVLYTANWGVYLYHKDKDPKMYLFLNSMLFALQCLHVYWFYFVLLLLARIVTGRMREVDDTRDYHERPKQNGHSHAD